MTQTRWSVEPAGLVQQGASGMPVYVTSDGISLPVEVGRESEALHDNPNFTAVTGSTPDDWNAAFEVDGTGIVTETSDVLFGVHSATLGVAAGDGSGFQTALSNPFSVNSGDTVEIGAWAHAITGASVISLGLLTHPTTPGFLVAGTIDQRAERQDLDADFKRFVKSFGIPDGHDQAAMYVVVDSPPGDAITVRVANTTSRLTGKAYRPVQAGVEAVALAAASQGFNTVTFADEFAAPPAVVVTTENADYIGATALVTATGCRVYVSHRNGTNATVSVNAHWHATART